MTSRRFTLLAAGLALVLACLLAGFNLLADEFGLYGLRTGPIRIWGYERASKFLLARRHIPERYEGLLLGSSSADIMMDTARLTGYRTYNLSINGGNICEVAAIARQALERGRFRFVVVALAPYLTKDCRMKTNELDPGLRRAALGSLFTLRFYRAKLGALLHPDSDPFRDSWSGYQQGLPPPVEGEAAGALERPLSTSNPVDPQAAAALEELLSLARSRGVRILAYFHPLLHPELRGGYPAHYLEQMRRLFGPEDFLWDFNEPAYSGITGDAANFTDGAHLSARGAGLVLAEIEKRLDAAVGRATASRAAGVSPGTGP